MNFLKRRENLQNYLKDKNIDLLIIDDVISLIYLTGLNLSSGKILITQKNSMLFVDGRYIQEAKQNSDMDVALIGEKALCDFIVQSRAKIIGFDGNKVSLTNFEKLKNFSNKINKKYNLDINLVVLDNPLKEFRVIKDMEEIALMKKAAALTWRGFEHICLFLKEGITEKEVAFEFEFFVKKNGAEKLSFDPIVCFAENTASPHHRPTNKKLKLNDIVLIDIGACIENYQSDMTRVIFFGAANPVLEKMYSIVKKAQFNALSICRPGTKLKDLDIAAKKIIKEENYEKEYLHSLGHGVGLEVHEFPRIKEDSEDQDVILKPGMVITIEPGIYVEGLGGVRYEDMILVTKDGYENFYSSN